MKRNLLILTDKFPRWEGDTAVSRYVQHLAESLSQHYKVYVLCPHSFCAARHQNIKNIEIIRFPYFYPRKWQILSNENGLQVSLKEKFLAKLIFPFLCIFELFYLYKTIKEKEIDIINIHELFPHAFLFVLIKPYLKISSILTETGASVSDISIKSFIKKKIIKFTLKKIDIILPVCIYTRYKLEKICGCSFNTKIVPMGVDNIKFRYFSDKIKLKSSLGIPKKNKIFLFIGKFIEKKGIQHLLEAVNILKNDYQDFTVLLIGRGPLEQNFKDWVVKQKISNYIKFLGWVDNDQLPPYYGISDAVIVPSTIDKEGGTDGLPIVVQESLAAGVPVIASCISGISEIIKDGYNGWLFEAGNHGDLCSAIKMVYKTDKNTIIQIKENALKSSDQFSYNTIADKYYHEIQQLLF